MRLPGNRSVNSRQREGRQRQQHIETEPDQHEQDQARLAQIAPSGFAGTR